MKGELDAGLLGDGQDGVQKPLQIIPQFRGGGGGGGLSVGIGYIASDGGEIEFGDPRSPAFDDFAAGSLPVFIGHPVIAEHLHLVFGHEPDEGFEVFHLLLPAGQAVDHFEMRHLAFKMRELHSLGFYHPSRLPKGVSVKAWKSQNNLIHTNLRSPLQVFGRERIDNH